MAVVAELARVEERLEDRRLGLLDLEDERIVIVASEEQRDPAAGADRADTDGLAGQVDVAKAVEQTAAARLDASSRFGWSPSCVTLSQNARSATRRRPPQ
jgi:hypothetical protein